MFAASKKAAIPSRPRSPRPTTFRQVATVAVSRTCGVLFRETRFWSNSKMILQVRILLAWTLKSMPLFGVLTIVTFTICLVGCACGHELRQCLALWGLHLCAVSTHILVAEFWIKRVEHNACALNNQWYARLSDAMRLLLLLVICSGVALLVGTVFGHKLKHCIADWWMNLCAVAIHILAAEWWIKRLEQSRQPNGCRAGGNASAFA